MDGDTGAREAIAAIKGLSSRAGREKLSLLLGQGADEFLATREQYLADARRDACIPYAMVVGGKWYEKGQMGWWGMASGEMSDEAWAEEVNKLLDGLDDDELVTVVDCHI